MFNRQHRRRGDAAQHAMGGLWLAATMIWIVLSSFHNLYQYVQIPWLQEFYWVVIILAWMVTSFGPPLVVYVVIGLLVLMYQGVMHGPDMPRDLPPDGIERRQRRHPRLG